MCDRELTVTFCCSPNRRLTSLITMAEGLTYTKKDFMTQFFDDATDQAGLTEMLNDAKLVIYKINNKLSKFPLTLDNGFKVKNNTASLDIMWEFTLTLYNYGTGISTLQGKQEFGKISGSSDLPFSKVMKRVNSINLGQGSKKYFLSNDLEFTEANFYSTASCEQNLFVLSERQSYSNMVLANLWSCVDFEFPYDKAQKDLRKVFDTSAIQTYGHRIMTRINRLDQYLCSKGKDRLARGP